ncbi:MAG: TIGR00268 family protein, partial [Candidatus Bathyarchaeia archaeon]
MIQEKIGRLQQILKKAQKICIAFSGGVDSSFLAFFSAQVLEKENVMLVLGKSPSLPPEEESA